MSWGKWAKHFLATQKSSGLKESSKVEIYLEELYREEYRNLTSHFYKMLVILLTVAFNTINWNFAVYKRLSIWIYTILIFETFLAGWFIVTSNQSARNFVYIKGRLQSICSCLGIILIFLYMGTTSKIKN